MRKSRWGRQLVGDAYYRLNVEITENIDFNSMTNKIGTSDPVDPEIPATYPQTLINGLPRLTLLNLQAKT